MRFGIFGKTKTTSFPVQPISWYRSLTYHYFFIQTCLALEKSGFFNALAARKELSMKELAILLGVDESLLKTCVEFLWATTDLLEKNGDKFALKEQQFSKSLWVLGAYKPVFDNLSEILKKEKRYGYDIIRDGFYLQKASDIFSEDAIRKALEVIAAEKDALLVDFGCGSAKALISFCRGAENRRGLGIDIDKDIVSEARGHVKEANLSGAIEIIRNDVLNMTEWGRLAVGNWRVIFLASTMLHEFLRDGERFVEDYLKRIRNEFPRSRFLIIEFDALPFKEIKTEENLERKLFAAMYELWHPLTNQGMPRPRAVWERMIQNAGWNIRAVIPAKNNLFIYDCE